MKKNIEIPIVVLMGLMFVIPFFNFYRYAPLGDWMTDGSFVFLFGFLLLLSIKSEWAFGPVAAALLVFVFVQVLSRGVFDGLVPMCFIFVMFVMAINVAGMREQILKNIQWLAAAILLAGVVQACIGYVQFFGLAKYFHGFVVYSTAQDRQIFGNFGQRNQFANFMAWSVISACYLYAIRWLNKFSFGFLLFVMLLGMTWSGSRTVLVYELGMLVLAIFWYLRSRHDAVVVRMCHAVFVSVVLNILMQSFSHQLTELFYLIGQPVSAESGLDRIVNNGFNGSRRIEWTKAWIIFKDHPWVGVGLGGYSYQSVWYEAFAGLPKFPEDVLFTNCHNLVLQLLAETGLIGCAVVLGGVFFSLIPYFYHQKQTAENLLLIVIAMVLLGHSMFEYPLWYMPFCGMLVFVCAMSPGRVLKNQFRVKYSAVLKALIGVLCIFYFLTGVGKFWFVVRHNMPSVSVPENSKAIQVLAEMQKNPLWSNDVSYALGNYLQPSREQLEVKVSFFDRLVKYRPYSEVLLKAAMLHSLAGDAKKAHEYIVMAIAAYPDDVGKMQAILRNSDAVAYSQLLEMVDRAKTAWDLAGVDNDAARMATVMTVAAPVTRKAIF